jgi:hypothetical protein
MDGRRFDAITKTLGTGRTRRGAVRVLGGLGITALTLARHGEVAAGQRERAEACRPMSRRTRGACMRGDCRAPGEACGVVLGDGFDSRCCSGICVGRGVCSAHSGCSSSGCSAEVECCYGRECDGSGNCVAW